MTCGAYYALSGLYWLVALVTQGVALGWSIAPLRGLVGVYPALSGLCGLTALRTQGVALGCFIAPLRGLGGVHSAFSRLHWLVALVTQGVALGWYIPPLRGLSKRLAEPPLPADCAPSGLGRGAPAGNANEPKP